MIRAISTDRHSKARAVRCPGLRSRVLGIVACAVVAGACAGAGATPERSAAPHASITAPAEETPPPRDPSPWTPGIEPVLEDRTGLATELAPVMPTTSFEEGLSVEGPENRTLLLSWYGSPCELEPTVLVDGSVEQLTLTVYRGPIEPWECPASQPARVLRLGLRTAVESAAATFSVREGLPPE